jgi:hypothetical protein
MYNPLQPQRLIFIDFLQIAAMSEMEFDKFVKPLENSLASKYQKLLLGLDWI